MRLQTLSFHIAAGLALPLLPQAPHYSAKDAVRAEWMRTPPTFSAEQIAKLPPADRARLELSLKRIGRPGSWDLLPTELAHPTQGQWDQKAEEARTPRERFDALFFLNRLKEKDALKALNGLKPEDARTWPKHLHLEAQIATARLNGGEVSAELQAFLDAQQKASKVDPVRAQAARLRLVMAGKEKELLPAVDMTSGSLLATMDSWNRGPLDKRMEVYKSNFFGPIFQGSDLGLAEPPPPPGMAYWVWTPDQAEVPGALQRLYEGLPDKFPERFLPQIIEAAMSQRLNHMSRIAAIEALGRSGHPNAAKVLGAIALNPGTPPVIQSAILPALRHCDPKAADELNHDLLLADTKDTMARAAAIDDLSSQPEIFANLRKNLCSGQWMSLIDEIFEDEHLESFQSLIAAFDRWKTPTEDRMKVLKRFLLHHDWAWRWEAYQALHKLDAGQQWPAPPSTSFRDQDIILKEAERLAEQAKPVRLRITFSGRRQVTMKLDPTVAPINVANLELLAKKHFFDGHLVPRVVPDFVVQMGSPFDTMDGGPGYTVRCEDSLTWYGPGSVGMALAGKDTGGCQFFITTNATPHLTGKYTRVGEVEDLDHAMKILDDLELGAKIESIRVVQ